MLNYLYAALSCFSFNFPAMIPLWSLPIAIACGNTLLIKPSERDPGAATMLVQLAEKAGVPPGVVSVIHGGPETVNYLCDDPRIKAISFVGGDKAGKHIWDRAGANGKRVQVCSARCTMRLSYRTLTTVAS